TGYVGYQINGSSTFVSGLNNEIKDGDIVDVYIMQSYAENYSFFDKYEAEVEAHETLPLTLTEMSYDDLFNTVYSGCADATITIDGETTPFKTDSEGKTNISIDKPGKYVVSATKTHETDDGIFTSITAPVCLLNVTSPKQYHTVNIDVPKNANIKFYECDGSDENGYDILGNELTVENIQENDIYNQYTLSLPEGRYSFRATNMQGASLGGMTFTVLPESEAQSGTAYLFTLRQLDVYTTTKYDGINYSTENEYTTTVMDSSEHMATAGDPYKSGNYTRYPYMLCAMGSAYPYAIQLLPSAIIAQTYGFGINTMYGYPLTPDTTIATKSGKLPTIIDAVITAPKDAKVSVYKQIKNFYTQEISPLSVTSKGETQDFTYGLPQNDGSHFYRVTMDGKITKAGYLNLSSEIDAKTVITFEDNENPHIRPEYDRANATQKRIEDSVVLNINKQNYLRLNIGDEFTAKAYRSSQIINGDTSNITIEPDFHYNIISGSSVTLEQQGSIATLKAVQKGISIIEVTYDAIQVTNKAVITTYGAIDPNRKGLFVVNVGDDSTTVINMTDWDSDFDTVYFLGEMGELNFTPTSDNEMTIKIDGSIISPNVDGAYALPIKQGNNIISVTSNDTTEYLIIKGKKVTANITNATDPSRQIKQGDLVSISFDGLNMPVPKMGGVYNPGYGSTMKIAYQRSDGGKVASKGTQYDFIANHTMTFKVFEEGTLTLTGGNIPMTCMGTEFGNHRYITDNGIPTNFNSIEISGAFSMLPELTIEVAKDETSNYLAALQNTYTNLSKVNILCGNSTVDKSFVVNKTSEALASEKNTSVKYTSLNNTHPLTINVEPVNAGVSMELRYWEEGDAEYKTAPVISGETLNLGAGVFSGDKLINMEIVVTPNNPTYGKTKTYSYVFYKATDEANTSILKNIEVYDSQRESFASPYGILRLENEAGLSYTRTNYECFVPKNTDQISLDVARLAGTSNITINGETKEVNTANTAFSQISLSGEITPITIDIADGRTYTLKVIKTDNPVIEAVADDGGVAVVRLLSPFEKNVNIFVGEYDGITLKQLICKADTLTQGDAVLIIDYSKLENAKSKNLFIWDEYMTEIGDRKYYLN
ncbi:MAG: hypothetical protein PHE51_01535, partial [Eubacteriales bacterium]|nr:hypothetical protein [Eubacteriales bacterium]